MLDRFRAARRAYQVDGRRQRRARQREEGGTSRPAAAATGKEATREGETEVNGRIEVNGRGGGSSLCRPSSSADLNSYPRCIQSRNQMRSDATVCIGSDTVIQPQYVKWIPSPRRPGPLLRPRRLRQRPTPSIPSHSSFKCAATS